MKITALRSALLASLALAFAQSAHATLLVGYSDFGFTSNVDNTPNETLAGFSGRLVKDASVTDVSTIGGSGDGYYGPDGPGGVAVGSLSPVANPTNNGRIGGVSGVSLTVTNGTTSAYILDSLLFDGRRNGELNPTSYTVSWTAPGGSGSQGGLAAVNGGGPTPYDDFSVSLGNLILGVNESIVFTWTATDATSRLDNIALTAIPEPGSLLALGCVVGSGFLIRRRNRLA